MNKKNIVTKENIEKVAGWLETACKDFQFNDSPGCYNFPLSDDLVLAVGWLDGYNMADEDIIKSKEGRRMRKYLDGEIEEGYAVNAGIKIRNDFDCADYEFLNMPYYEDGEVWMTDVSMKPNQTRREYRRLARWFLESFVGITNAYNRGEICYE